MPEIDPEEALDLYNRAKLFKFEELADKCKRMLCNTPISKLSRDTISMISIELLMEIVSGLT